MLYEDFMKERKQETLDFHGVSAWHSMGFKGKGINFLELEDSEHGEAVVDMFSLVAPESKTFLHGYTQQSKGDECLYFNVIVDGNPIDLKEFVKENNIHIIGLSVSSESEGMPRPAEEYLKSLGVVLVGAAGNNDLQGVTGNFERIGINIGAIKLIKGNVMVEHYSATGEDSLHFTTLHGELNGTSFAQPVFSGMAALIMQRYGIVSQERIIEIMKSICLDVGDAGYDTTFGWGVPILPEKIEMLEGDNLNGLLDVDNIDGVPFVKHLISDFTNREAYYMTPEYITIHNFGTSANALDVTKYVDSTDEVKSWHFTVGRNAIYQEMSIFKNGWHAGDGLNGIGNRKSIAIEIEENEQAMLNAVKLIAYLRKELGNLEIKTHQDWSGKYCPRWILNNYSKDYFIKSVEEYEMKFKDVEESRWSYKAIDYVTDKGYMKGFPDGTFKPSEPLTREQMAQVLYNMENQQG